jgi:regulator of sigma E protease
VLTLLAFLVVIGVLVFVHELGHLVAAKSVDIEVPRFSIGFGPRLAGFRWGETEYVISALPLGGYVRMAGMEETAALEGGEDPDRATDGREFDAKPLWARVWVVSAGVLMNFLFAILVIAGLAFAYGEPVNPSTRIAPPPAERLQGAAAPLAAVPSGARITAVGGEPVDSWNAVLRELRSAPAGPLTVEFEQAEPVTLRVPSDQTSRQQLVLAFEPFLEPVVGQVMPGTPAAAAGLQSGDRIVAAGGEPVTSWTQFVAVVRDHPGRPLTLEIVRGQQRLPVEVVPDVERELDEEMRRVEIGRIGIAPQTEIVHRPLGPLQSLERGAQVTWGTSTMIIGLLGDLFTGDASPRTLGGPVAIGQISGEAARGGMEMFLNWMALLSINLAVLNLLPIPVLDGGQLLFLGVEAVRGRPLSLEQRLRLSHVGLILVVGLMVWVITNDFLRLFGI